MSYVQWIEPKYTGIVNINGENYHFWELLDLTERVGSLTLPTEFQNSPEFLKIRFDNLSEPFYNTCMGKLVDRAMLLLEQETNASSRQSKTNREK